MVKISDMDEYLKAAHVSDGDVVEIAGKPRLVTADESVFERAYLELPVKLANGKTKIWTPNRTTLRELAKVFGDDADTWVGKRVKITISRQNVRGKMTDVVYGEPFTQVPQPQAKQEALA